MQIIKPAVLEVRLTCFQSKDQIFEDQQDFQLRPTIMMLS